MKLKADEPKSLRHLVAREARLAVIREEHMIPLTRLVEAIRQERGTTQEAPYFDAADGGIHARCLFLLEAPGAQAVLSGFVSRNNPDETAKSFFLLNQEAGLPRDLTITWNVVPWYVGDGRTIRAVTREDINDASPYLGRFLHLLPNLEVIVLVGRKAQRVDHYMRKTMPQAEILNMLHPSPRVINRFPRNRPAMLETLIAAKNSIQSTNHRMADA